MKFFVVSDIHSHFNFLKKALEEQGFEKNHKNHKLIINGDIFDRGGESQELKNFLDEIDNKMFVFGNHEFLLLHAINRGKFMKHDLLNGTMDTAIQLTGGFAAYPEIKWGKLRPTFSPVETYGNELKNKRIQKKIINRLIETNIVEWIVDNFYLDGSEVKWNDDRTSFKIIGSPRYFIQIENRLITHGFFPSPDFIKSYSRKDLKRTYVHLPDDYDLLGESTQEMWEELGTGIWSDTLYWLKKFFEYKLTKLYDYLLRKNIEHIYLGHWNIKEIEKLVFTVNMTPDYFKYENKLPKFYFTDGAVVVSKKVLVETFEI